MFTSYCQPGGFSACLMDWYCSLVVRLPVGHTIHYTTGICGIATDLVATVT